WRSDGSKVGTSKSTLAGEHSTTRTKGNTPRKNFWRYILTSSLRRTRHQLSRCCNKRVLSRLFLWLLPTRSGGALSESGPAGRQGDWFHRHAANHECQMAGAA